ncbi:MAG TPA: hypothetical protein VK524_13215 [Polyangiaceae bacterium]|nr:hypothetical protein [Polyangiaceae bacterium]
MSKLERFAYSTTLPALAARLIRVATPGVLVAACGATTPQGGVGGAGGTSGLPNLPPPPPGGNSDAGSGYPQCYGEGNPMLFGPCCLRVFCIEPPAGSAQCKAASAVVPSDIGYPSLGSGTCTCGVPGRPPGISGPYSPESAQQYSTVQGRCCYVAPLQWCTGRPLLVEGRGLVAELVFSSGWV